MIYPMIQSRKQRWVQSPMCPITPLLGYIRQRGQLRDAQIEAIETYLFLKLEGEGKPLAELFAAGFFFEPPQNLERVLMTMQARTVLSSDPAAWSLYQLARTAQNGGVLLPKLEQSIRDDPDAIPFREVISRIFYNVTYPDYLFSLPMGAGKTFLIAALIYLDLYYAQQNPDDARFAHNFLVLIPSGLKSSIVPSLKTIEQFDPSWILPEPAASNLRRLLHFEMLDQPKSAKKSNRVRNPNAQKVNALISQPDPMGLIFLVNAEKVILDRLELGVQLELIEKSEDEQSRAANELRHLIGKIPRLCIHIDEVHHATDDEIKLRQVVTAWNQRDNVTCVLGYSGTPYLPGVDKVAANADVEMHFRQITNTVYYYPLTRAIQLFLKKPAIKTAEGLTPEEIIRRGVQEFYALYGDTRYADGSIAKLAIYCGSIQRLEEDIYPLVRDQLGIPEAEILKFHKGNASYKPGQGAALEFATLDAPTSQKRVILLVQVGKEGWDCRSLTGVILAQKNDSPQNMVLQTSCRCLRQVDKGKLETALIWLNGENAAILQKQLQAEQQTTIQEINAIAKTPDAVTVARHARIEYLKLPPVKFFQLRIDYGAQLHAAAPEPAAHLRDLAQRLDNYRHAALVQSGALTGESATYLMLDDTHIVAELAGERTRFDLWLAQIARESLGGVTYADLKAHAATLQTIFAAVTVARSGARFANDLYDHDRLRSAIRTAFYARRTLATNEQVIQQHAQLLVADALTPALPKHLYPPAADVQAILLGTARASTASS